MICSPLHQRASWIRKPDKKIYENGYLRTEKTVGRPERIQHRIKKRLQDGIEIQSGFQGTLKDRLTRASCLVPLETCRFHAIGCHNWIDGGEN